VLEALAVRPAEDLPSILAADAQGRRLAHERIFARAA